MPIASLMSRTHWQKKLAPHNLFYQLRKHLGQISQPNSNGHLATFGLLCPPASAIYAKVISDSRIDFLPCFMACETNVPGYALGGPLVVAMCALRLHRSVRESFPYSAMRDDVLSKTTERGNLS